MAETTERVGVFPSEPIRHSDNPAESEARFRNLVDALPDAILVHCDNKIVFVNPFCVRLLAARGPEELLGKEISSVIDPHYLSAIRERISDCISTGTASPPTESLMIACDGSSVPIEAVAIPTTWNGSPAIEVVLRDIRRRKQAEREVDEFQKRLELAQKAGLRMGLWDWNITTNTVKWSDETYRQFGFTRGAFSGHIEDAVARIHPDDRPRVDEAVQAVLSGKAEYAAKYRIVRPDGSMCWIDAHGVVVRDESTHMIGVGVDITEVKNAEQLRQESEEKYLLLLNSTAEAIYGIDEKGLCTFCNPPCVRLLGYQSPQELLGKNMHTLMHHSRADGKPYPRVECEIYVAFRDGKANHVTNEVLWRKDGTSFAAEYWSYPIYKNAKVVGAVVTFLDISDRRRAEEALRRSEERYRVLFENATYGIFRSRPDGTLLDANRALVAMLGYDSAEELISRNLVHDIYEDVGARASIVEKLAKAGSVQGAEVNWRRKDGTIIAVRLSGRVVRGENGTLFDYDAIVEDITERRSLEMQFRQAQKMEAIGLLAGGISHDFNNLLSVILGNAELLLERTSAGPEQHYAEEIQRSTARAAQLTRQLLAFSRKQVLYPTILDLNAIVQDVVKILQRLIGEDIRVVTRLETHLGSVRVDRGQIEQILMNLATNARDAMPNGGEFTIRTENAALGEADVARYAYVTPGQYVRLSASDVGVGMSEEIRSRIFEPFFTTKAEGHGTGLGLATVYGIVKQSGGYIWVSSKPGAGTTFDIYLPRTEEKAIPHVSAPEVRTEFPRGTETILVLEDEDALRAVTVEFLTASGYKVLESACGNDAVALVARYKGTISLIVSDVVLPDMNGPSVVTKLKALHPEMKAVYVSGYSEVPVAQKLIAEGAILLQKPVSRRNLLRKVDEILHRQSDPVPR